MQAAGPSSPPSKCQRSLKVSMKFMSMVCVNSGQVRSGGMRHGGAAANGVGSDRVNASARMTASFDDIYVNAAATYSVQTGGRLSLKGVTVAGLDFAIPAWWDESVFVPRMVPVDAGAVLN